MVKEFMFTFNTQWAAGGQETDPKPINKMIIADSFDEAIESLRKYLACLHENFSWGFKVHFDSQWHDIITEHSSVLRNKVWREHICMNKVKFELKK